jgi:glycosyltransferase involved in cell wall biosynthesis
VSTARIRRIALVHDWLTGMRGGEKVLECLIELYPDADVFTLVQVPGSGSPTIERRVARRSVVQRFPRAARFYRQYLLTFPAVIEQFDLDEYDLVLSTSHCAAKAVVPTGRAVHLCYCHTPMRYAWDQFDAYFGPARVGRRQSALLRRAMAWMARWDAATSARVDRYVANSAHVAWRIGRYYNRLASVVHPPVDTSFFHPDGSAPGAGFLIVSALVPYKRLDVAIAACARVGAPLRIVGQGPDRGRLEQLAGPSVEFMGSVTDIRLRQCYRECRAALLPGEEDFGIAPVEAQACGRPVVALGRGGALETVEDGRTGVLVEDDSAEAFAEGLRRVTREPYAPAVLRAHALQFSRDRFISAMSAVIDDALHGAPPAAPSAD